MTGFNLARYTVDIFGPESEPAEEGSAYRWAETDARVLADLPYMIEVITRELQYRLPEGYSVRIESQASV